MEFECEIVFTVSRLSWSKIILKNPKNAVCVSEKSFFEFSKIETKSHFVHIAHESTLFHNCKNIKMLEGNKTQIKSVNQ